MESLFTFVVALQKLRVGNTRAKASLWEEKKKAQL